MEKFSAPAGSGFGMAGLATGPVGARPSFAGVKIAVNAILASAEFLATGRVATDSVESRVAGADAFDLGSTAGGVTAAGNAGIVTTGVTAVISASAAVRGCLRGACAADGLVSPAADSRYRQSKEAGPEGDRPAERPPSVRWADWRAKAPDSGWRRTPCSPVSSFLKPRFPTKARPTWNGSWRRRSEPAMPRLLGN